MEKNKKSKKQNSDQNFRSCLGIAIINHKRQILVFQRIDNPGTCWQIPQGGLEKGESEIEGAYRELFEEVGLSKKHLTLIEEIPDLFYYKIPQELKKVLWQGKYDGQKIRWFVFSLNKSSKSMKKLDLTHHSHPEFLAWKWLDIDFLDKIAIQFKKELYLKLKTHLLANYSSYEL